MQIKAPKPYRIDKRALEELGISVPEPKQPKPVEQAEQKRELAVNIPTPHRGEATEMLEVPEDEDRPPRPVEMSKDRNNIIYVAGGDDGIGAYDRFTHFDRCINDGVKLRGWKTKTGMKQIECNKCTKCGADYESFKASYAVSHGEGKIPILMAPQEDDEGQWAWQCTKCEETIQAKVVEKVDMNSQTISYYVTQFCENCTPKRPEANLEVYEPPEEYGLNNLSDVMQHQDPKSDPDPPRPRTDESKECKEAMSKLTTSKRLGELANSTDPRVRSYAAENPNISENTLAMLSCDGDEGVRQSAHNNPCWDFYFPPKSDASSPSRAFPGYQQHI